MVFRYGIISMVEKFDRDGCCFLMWFFYYDLVSIVFENCFVLVSEKFGFMIIELLVDVIFLFLLRICVWCFKVFF